MILDQINVFTDNKAVTASGNSAVLEVAPFSGKGADIQVAVVVTQPYAAAASLTVAVQEGDAPGGAFTTLDTVAFPGIKNAGAALFINLPRTLKKKYVRLAYTVTGSTSTGKLFAGITRDTGETYEPGLYIDGGVRG